jgi:hypothetical protein
MSRFEDALRQIANGGTPAERRRMQNAADDLMRILARVLIETE